MKLRTRIGASLAAVALAVAAVGQTTTPPPATCTTPPTGLTALNIERAITLTNILTTMTPNPQVVPANLLTSISSGALELREIMIFNPQLQTITSTLFTVAAGAPLPTPNFNFSTGVLQTATFKITQIMFGCNPVPSMLILGTLSGTNTLFGSATNVPAAISIGFTTDNPPKINNVAEVAAGLALAWSASASGTFTAQFSTSGGGTTPGAGPTIVVKLPDSSVAKPNTTVQVGASPFLLDASGSTGSGALTFAWSSSSNSPVAFVATGTPGQIFVQFPGPGDYTINLTVTDAMGNKSTFSITLEFLGRPQ